jgi:hypothetical protein
VPPLIPPSARPPVCGRQSSVSVDTTPQSLVAARLLFESRSEVAVGGGKIRRASSYTAGGGSTGAADQSVAKPDAPLSASKAGGRLEPGRTPWGDLRVGAKVSSLFARAEDTA